MKKLIFLAAISTLATAQEYSVEQRYEQSEDATLNELINELETNEMFAGKYTELTVRGKQYAVDRRKEALKTPAGTPPRAPIVGRLLSDLGIKSEGQVSIRVTHREFSVDGKMTSEDIWEINMGGAWQAQSGMDEAMGKYHK